MEVGYFEKPVEKYEHMFYNLEKDIFGETCKHSFSCMGAGLLWKRLAREI